MFFHSCSFSLSPPSDHSPDLAKSCVLPELTELASDEETSVRAAALETISEIIPHLPPEVVTSTLVPLMRKFCLQSLSSGSETLPCVARLLGKLSNQLKGTKREEGRMSVLSPMMQS